LIFLQQKFIAQSKAAKKRIKYPTYEFLSQSRKDLPAGRRGAEE
jgi:hypothetical protein